MQTGTSFNIDGIGSAATFNATSQYSLRGVPVLGSNGAFSLFVGPGAGQSNAGSQNSFMGVSAGQTNTTGSYNSFAGYNAGYSNTTGSYNSFAGTNSGYSNTTGNYNSFTGYNAGYSNTTGSHNIFVGTGSGRFNTTGSFLTFLGRQSGLYNTTGNYNSFMGTYSGFSNTTGSLLTFLGMQSGYLNTTGNYNSFMGTNSGYSNTTGSYLTFLGLQSGFSNTTGNYNSFVGTYSGFSNTTGSFNMFLGYNAGLNANPVASNNIYISSLGASGDSGTIRIGDSANQTAAYLAGVSGVSISGGQPVVINSNGQLGTGSAGLGVTSFNGRTGAVIPESGDYNFSLLSGTLGSSQLSGSYSASITLSNASNSFSGNGAGLTGLQFSQLGGAVANSQFGGTYSNAVTLSNGANSFVGSGASLTGIQFSQLAGSLGSSQFAGTYGNAVAMSNGSNIFNGTFTGNGTGLTGVLPAAGSANYIQNGTSQQASTNFNVSGNWTLGGTLSANTVNSATSYQIGASSVLSAPGTGNLFLGQGAGSNNGTGSNNVYLINPGVTAENATLRLGDPAVQTAAYVAGVSGVSISGGQPVVINSSGQLGTGSAGLGVTSFKGRTGAVVPAANDYDFSLLSGTLGSSQLIGSYGGAVTLNNASNSFAGNGAGLTGLQFSQIAGALPSSQLAGIYSSPVTLSNAGNSFTGNFSGNGAGLTGIQFSQLGGNLASSQLSGTYSNSLTLSNASNVFNGSFAGNGSGLTGVPTGLLWPLVKMSTNYTIQTSDFSTATSYGNFVILTGSVSRTFTLPNPAPPNGSCVAIGDFAVSLPGSNTNVYLSVSANGLTVDGSSSVVLTHIGWEAYLYCSDGTGYWRLGFAQMAPNKIGPWLKTVDTGTTNALKTTFVHGLDVGLVHGTMFYLLPSNANTSSTPTLNVNGLGAKNIVKFGNQPLAPGDLTTVAYAHLFYDGANWQLLNPQTNQGTVTAVTAAAPLISTGGPAPTISCPTCVTTPLTGTTGSIGGSALTAGSCTTGTAAVAGATTGHPVSVSASDGSLPNGLIILSAAVTSANTVTVQLCAVASVTPAANTYNIATQ